MLDLSDLSDDILFGIFVKPLNILSEVHNRHVNGGLSLIFVVLER